MVNMKRESLVSNILLLPYFSGTGRKFRYKSHFLRPPITFARDDAGMYYEVVLLHS